MDQTQRAFRRLLRNRLDQIVENAFRHHAQQFAHLHIGNRVAAIRNGLFQQRQPVAHAAFRRPRQHRHRARLDLYFFFRRDPLDLFRDFREGQRPKLKKLRPRLDRLHQIFRARRRQNKHHSFRRLFQGFQQGIRSFIGELVRFIQNHNFVAAIRRRVPHHLAQFANLIDTAVRRRINLDHVQRPPLRNLPARSACSIRIGRGPFLAVQCLGQNSRRRGFAHTAHARKNIRVRHPVRIDGVRDSPGDVLLAYDFTEGLRAVFAGNNLITHVFGSPVSRRRMKHS